MALKEAIDAIIERRHEKAESFAKRQATYEDIMKRVKKIVEAKHAIDGNNSKVEEILGRDFIEAVQDINIESFNAKYDELAQLLDQVKARYSKEEINISVVGMARQGKSKLLQSISGLGDNVIPAFDTSDCTGAVSVIRNVDGANLGARVYFYSSKDMIQVINRYIHDIGRGIIEDVHTLAEIAKIDIKKLREALNKEQTFDIEKGEQLARYIENYDIWSKLVEKYGNTGEFKELHDENEIIKYVAQYNGKRETEPGRENYFNYLAVSKVEISCQFNYADAGRIVLRDTIGLGDAKMIGLTDSMLDSIAGDCDAAIVIKRPKDNTDNMREEDGKLYEILKRACENRGLDMNKWFFYVINHVKGPADNSTACSTVKKQIHSLAMADSFIADVSDTNEVTNNIIIPMLSKLKDNLPSLDNALEERLEEKAEEVYKEYERLIRACKKANDCPDIQINIGEGLAAEFTKSWYSFGEKLESLYRKYNSKRGVDNCEFCEAVAALSPDIDSKNSLVPSEDIILHFLERPGANGYATSVATDVANMLRCEFTKRFVNMDELMNGLVYDMQEAICNMLVDPMKFDQLVGCTPDEYGEHLKTQLIKELRERDPDFDEEDLKFNDKEKYAKWLMLVHDTISKSSCFKSPQYANILIAIKFIANFNISVRSFLMHKVRSSIDMIDPNINKGIINRVNNVNSNTDLRSMAHMIREMLCDLYIEAFQEVEIKVKKMYKDPNELLYAAIAEFRDKVIYSATTSSRDNSVISVEDSWRVFYETGDKNGIFNKEIHVARKIAEELRDQFRELICNRLSRDAFFNKNNQ